MPSMLEWLRDPFFSMTMSIHKVLIINAGVFIKESSVNVKKSIVMMKEMNQEGLVNLVKFGSLHFGDQSTPKNLKALMQ
jgi:hypothetical protein